MHATTHPFHPGSVRRVRTTRRRSLAAVLASGAIIVSACGGEAEQSDPGIAVTAAPTTPDLDTAEDTGVTTVVPDDASDAPAEISDDPGTDDPGSDDDLAEPETPDPTAEAPEILQFSSPVVGGGELDLAAFGDRPVLLWFWAPF